jgi:trk system potassium uptake protein TrkA
MNIIIVGAGKVGYTLAENLTSEDHDITIIDNDSIALNKASETLDVLCIKGNGASISILKEAQVERADVLIAVTNRDELNMVCCLTAKKFGAKYTVARIRDFEYAKEISHLKNELEIDMVINPEHSTAEQIFRLLRFPAALDIDTFFRGRIELVGFRAAKGDIFTGKPLYSVRKHFGNTQVLFCTVEHDGKVVIPNGTTVIEPGDKVHVIGDIWGISKFFRDLGRLSPKIKHVLIIGGGRISAYLSVFLSTINMNVKIIELDHRKCLDLCSALPKALVVNGDGTEQEVLDTEGIRHADAFVALTGRDEDNLITSLYAKQVGVPKIVTKVNRLNYNSVIENLGIDSFISPKKTTAYIILQYIRAMQNSQGSRMEALYQIADGAAEALEFCIGESTRNLYVPLKEINLKNGILIAAIVRKGKIIIPEGTDHLAKDDNVIIISSGMRIYDINDIFAE